MSLLDQGGYTSTSRKSLENKNEHEHEQENLSGMRYLELLQEDLFQNLAVVRGRHQLEKYGFRQYLNTLNPKTTGSKYYYYKTTVQKTRFAYSSLASPPFKSVRFHSGYILYILEYSTNR